MSKQRRIAITMGEPGGVGPEVIVRALHSGQIGADCRPVVIGNTDVMEEAVRTTGVPVTLETVSDIKESGPSPGSVEGMIYTVLPFADHFKGWPEVMIQALLFSLILTYWVEHPGKRWLNWLLVLVFLIVLILPAMGLLFA